MTKNNRNREGGFVELIVILIGAVLLMNYFNLTLSGVLTYFNTSPAEIIAWIKSAFLNVLK